MMNGEIMIAHIPKTLEYNVLQQVKATSVCCKESLSSTPFEFALLIRKRNIKITSHAFAPLKKFVSANFYNIYLSCVHAHTRYAGVLLTDKMNFISRNSFVLIAHT